MPTDTLNRTPIIKHTILYHLIMAAICGWALFILGCALPEAPPASRRVAKPVPRPVASTPARDFREQGIASWYGEDFHGLKTSSGETYDMHAMTAAHKSLPLGTYVRVRNLSNDKEVVVRINDRGPFVAGRIIDLSFSAAKAVGLVGPGTASVEVVALGYLRETVVDGEVRQAFVPADYYAGSFALQVGAFKERANADRLRDSLARTYNDAKVIAYEGREGRFYRVRVVQCSSLDEARHYEKVLETQGYPGAIVVAP